MFPKSLKPFVAVRTICLFLEAVLADALAAVWTPVHTLKHLLALGAMEHCPLVGAALGFRLEITF